MVLKGEDMIKVIGNKNNTIYYECTCGTKGRCLIRPLGEGDSIVADLECAYCKDNERLVLLQEVHDGISSEDLSMTWSLVLTNDVINEN